LQDCASSDVIRVLMKQYIKQRIQRVFNKTDLPLEGILVKNEGETVFEKNFFYLTGLTTGLYEGCIVIAYPDGSLDLFVSELEAELAKQAEGDLHIFRSRTELQQQLQNAIGSLTHIGLNFSGLSHYECQILIKEHPQITFYNVSNAFVQARMIKDTEEIHAIKQACIISDRVAEKIPSLITINMTEHDLAAGINYHLQRYGAIAPAFDTISSFGAHTSQPHYTHGTTQLKEGDFILCDFGAKLNQYHSDITRTFVYQKKTLQQQEIYEIVQQAQYAALETIQPGIPAQQVHNAAVQVIDKSPYKGRFIHSTGHSLGLSVHDGGIGFTETCETLLQPGMVLTVEPGIYIPSVGGVRIEDDIVVTKEGYTSLSNAKKSFLEIS